VFQIVQYSILHTQEYKFLFNIVEFEMDNFRTFENMRLQKKLWGAKKKLLTFKICESICSVLHLSRTDCRLCRVGLSGPVD